MSAFTERKPGARLEISGGKCAIVEKTRGTPEKHDIVFKLLRGTKQNVTLYPRMLADTTVSFALCFEMKNKKYFPIVQRAKDKSDKDEIQFQVRKFSCEPSQITFDEMYLFKWRDEGQTWGPLVSVAEPSKYLSVSNNRAILSSNPHNFKITPMKIFESEITNNVD